MTRDKNLIRFNFSDIKEALQLLGEKRGMSGSFEVLERITATISEFDNSILKAGVEYILVPK